MKSVRSLVPVVVFAALAGCGRHSESAAPAPALPVAQVRVAPVQAENLANPVDVTGTVRPVQRAQLAAKVMGAITELPVALGQRVRRGDLLVQISAGEINARLAQARSQLNAARRDLDRERDLLGKGASTADLVKGLEDRFAGAEAMVREAEVMLGYATVRAPFDGVVARKFAHAGDLAAPGYPLLELEGATEFQVEAGVPDSLARQLAPGAAVPIELPAAGATFTGMLAELSSASEASARTVSAKFSVPAGVAVHSGQFARVQLPGPAVRMLLVPAPAVTALGQMERAFVVGAGNRAVLRLVKTGAVRGSRVEILAGLDEGERVVVHGTAALREGQALEILP